MRNLVFCIILLLLAPRPQAVACDICGCANSGAYFGLQPQSHKSLVGVRYQRMRSVTHGESPVLRTEEHFNIGELYTRFFPVKRVQVMAFVPFRADKQITSADVKKQSGLGDITVLANYNLFNTFMDSENARTFNHTLLIGGGVKLPTGKFRFDENNALQVANANFQLGTGSTDWILNAFYTISKDKWGLAANLSRKFNTTNSEDYRFGNQFYGTLDLYRSIELGKLTLTPVVGIYGEHASHGVQKGEILDITGGRLLNATAGLTLFADKWTVGITGQKPVTQKSASGHVQAKERLLVQFAVLF
ncbi:hypothetical protein SAMN04487996_12535 [Dyadobacter soli]|uniref:MetA-pathway of phenol degradation n=1 Tax=Dyadobacter soli TaxID=659014 RepID=A0A1G7Y2K4_9BACT|nr:transporter [Dyadobacter soli]SDG90671.1 hypothetical protein SAMN04487996_12535 [Dyadobacter soli]